MPLKDIPNGDKINAKCMTPHPSKAEEELNETTFAFIAALCLLLDPRELTRAVEFAQVRLQAGWFDPLQLYKDIPRPPRTHLHVL